MFYSCLFSRYMHTKNFRGESSSENITKELYSLPCGTVTNFSFVIWIQNSFNSMASTLRVIFKVKDKIMKIHSLENCIAWYFSMKCLLQNEQS